MGFIQVNKLIDSRETVEKDGKLVSFPKRYLVGFIAPDLYKCYDTFKKQYGLTRKSENTVIVVNSENFNN